MPEISIIVPVYKVEQYLDECVNSLIHQTFQDIEIILVDDGSPDNCGTLCDNFANSDNRVRVIHKENGGLSSARNAGIQAAVGQYICFVDSDDFVSEQYCEILYQLISNSTCDFSVCGVHRFEDGNFSIPGVESIKIQTLSNIDFLHAQIQRKSEFGVWNKLYRKSVFDTIRFKEGKLNEDVILSADLAAHFTNGVISTSQKCYYYRQRKNSIVSQQTEKASPDRVFAGQYLISSVEKTAPELIDETVHYAIDYPWMFIDPILVHHQSHQNRVFLNELQSVIRKNKDVIQKTKLFSPIQKHRMLLFAKNQMLYTINAYIRLFRVYLYRIIRKDPYADGHGI